MERNVYSLVLLDEVVDAVDRMACERNTSRSGLINRILAEYLSCPIPELRIGSILDCMERTLSGEEGIFVQPQQSGSAISIRSVLRYRYRPTVRYVLELFRSGGPELGELRVSTRTQNEALLQRITDFFLFWSAMEERFSSSRFPGGKVPCAVSEGRYERRMHLSDGREERTDEEVAEAICRFIREFDSALKEYFSGRDGADRLEREYRDYLETAELLL